MTFSTEWRANLRGYEQSYDQAVSGNVLTQRMAAAAVARIAFACAFTLWTNLGGAGTGLETETGADAEQTAAVPQAKLPPSAWGAAARRAALTAGYDKLSRALHGYARTASNDYARLFDSHFLGLPSGAFFQSADVVADNPPDEPASGETIVPKTRTAALAPAADQPAAKAAPGLPLRLAPLHTASLRDRAHIDRVAVAAPPVEKPSIFERLFGKPAPVTLAYAAPDDGDLGGGQSLVPGRYDRYTAVYDISAHVVYMPDGSTLEAHSGLGDRLDDPRHADERMRGVTPPTLYDLKPRESLFHGVQALRLIPEDEGKVFGRSGLLAHTFMLGPNGDSNGCVSFRNYNAFLQAYMSHKIRRLAVVSRLE